MSWRGNYISRFKTHGCLLYWYCRCHRHWKEEQLYKDKTPKQNKNKKINEHAKVGIAIAASAILFFGCILAIESGILEVVNELGINYACLGDYEEAIKCIKKGFEASRDVEICTNIIMCYLNLGDEENAKLHLDIAKKLNPDDEIVQKIERMFIK